MIIVHARRRSRILDIKTLEEDPGAAQEFARSKAAARKEGLTGVEFKDIAGLDPILGEVLEVRLCHHTLGVTVQGCTHKKRLLLRGRALQEPEVTCRFQGSTCVSGVAWVAFGVLAARKQGLTGVDFKDIAGLDPILGEVLEVRCCC
jgi:hypothetical protein